MEDRTPYSYLIGWPEHNKWYYGIRYAKGCHPDDLWVTYKTSSKYVLEFAANHGSPTFIEIRKIFESIDSAREWEHKVLRRVGAVNKAYFLNQTDNKSISVEACAKGRAGKIGNRLGSTNKKLSDLNRLKIGDKNPFYNKNILRKY